MRRVMASTFPRDRLFETYAPRIYAVARRMCGNDADARDVVQDTFLQAHRRWETFRGKSDPGTWLYAIAVRRCRRAIIRPRKRGREMPQFSQVAPFADRTVIDTTLSGAGPAERAATAEQVALMEDAVAELPEAFRLPLLLKDILELSVEETADVLGIKEATVKTRVHRARLLLRSRLMRATPRRAAPSPIYPRRVCMDLLKAKLAAMDRGRGVSLGKPVVCERCRAVFAELDLTQTVCASLGKREISKALRRLRGVERENPGTPVVRRASKDRRRARAK